MKAIKDKKTGKLSVQVKKKDPVVTHWADPDRDDKKAKRQFGQNLRDSKIDNEMEFDKTNPNKWIRKG
jgi:hypothetical protein